MRIPPMDPAETRTSFMKSSAFALVVLVSALLLLTGACENDAAFSPPSGPFDLTFSGDASFQGPHGGQSIEVAVIDASSGETVETASGTVSATEDPSFEFFFEGALTRGEHYYIDYWIDSNFSDGSVGTCDPPANDHQWRNLLPRASDPDGVVANAIMPDVHRPAETESVCESFQ